MRRSLIDRIVAERVGQTVVGTVSVAVDRIAEEIAGEALAGAEATFSTQEARMFTIIDGVNPLQVAAQIAGDRVRLLVGDVQRALGWEVKPDMVCNDTMCIPLPDGARLATPDGIDLAELARTLDRPLAVDVAEGAACLGASARERGEALASLLAPDFSLPDLEGRVHRLSEHRGKKVLLVAYASW